MSKNEKILNVQRVWAMVGSFLVIAIIGFVYAPVEAVLSELHLFITFNAQNIIPSSENLIRILPDILLIVTIDITISIIGIVFINNKLGHRKGPNILDKRLNVNQQPKNVFKELFLLVVIEEAFARYLFLGILTQISFFSGTIGFYILLLVGNGIWAWIHIYNFQEKEDQQIIRILPQFLGGIFLSYVFVKYGFMAAVLTHFIGNGIIYSLTKVMVTGVRQLVRALISCLICVVCWILMDHPLSDLLAWVDTSNIVGIPGWSVWDYVLACLFFGNAAQVIFTVLAYDTVTIKKRTGQKLDFLETMIGSVAIILVLYLLIWGLVFLIEDLLTRLLIVTIFIVFSLKNPSANGAVRSFWSTVPTYFILIGSLHTLPFIDAVVMIVSLITIENGVNKIVDG